MAIPGPPVFEPETTKAVADLTAKGASGTIFLTTEDCRASYEELKGRGVEFVDAPEERPYGIDASFRDPSGNHIRLTQVRRWRRSEPLPPVGPTRPLHMEGSGRLGPRSSRRACSPGVGELRPPGDASCTASA